MWCSAKKSLGTIKCCSKYNLVKTGDILQFGVDVDNNPRTTYWCVIAQVLCNQQNYEFTEADWEPLNRYTKVNMYNIYIYMNIFFRGDLWFYNYGLWSICWFRHAVKVVTMSQ